MYEENSKEIYSISPNFNFIYELLMPTGRKIKATLAIVIFVLIGLITVYTFGGNMDALKVKINNNLDIITIFEYILWVLFIISALKLAFHIIFQKLQYSNITYKFYDKYMIYEDDFLNQHKKIIQYANIKEIEVRRTIWDRLMGFGVIIIYTNAENEHNNGLVIYSIKDPREKYERIDTIIHSITKEDNVINPTLNEVITQNNEDDEKAFRDSIKNINE